MKLTFVYTDLPFWRAEVGRLALFMGDIDFSDLRITNEEFLRLRDSGHLDDGTLIPFHQIPCLIVDGVSISQTAGIARFCGRLSCLYPKNNDLLAAKIDQFLDIATDITVLVSAAGKVDKDGKSTVNREQLFKGDLSRKLGMLNKNIDEPSEWIVGSDISVADIAIWRLIGWLSSGMLDGIPITLLEDFPKIRRVCRAVDAHPKVQEWISRTYPENYQRGNY